MLLALPTLITPPTNARVRPSPSLPEEGRYHSVSTQELENPRSHRLGGSAESGLMTGLELVVGNLKVLLPEFLLSMSSRHLWVACSVALRSRKRGYISVLCFSEGESLPGLPPPLLAGPPVRFPPPPCETGPTGW